MAIQGITTHALDVNNPSVQARDNWINDLKALGTSATGRLKLRLILRANGSNTVPIDQYKEVISRYTLNGFEVFALLGAEWDRSSGSDALPLPGNPLNTTYVDNFSHRSAHYAGQLRPTGLRSYIIWNEPNNSQGHPDGIPYQTFAAMMYQSYHRIRAIVPDAQIIMGGILWPIGTVPNEDSATDNVVAYLSNVYNYLRSNGGGIPWDAVNVHVHHGIKDGRFIAADRIASLRQRIDGVFSPADRRPVYVGEWGPTHDEAAIEGCTLNIYTAIRNNFDAMFFFQHPNLLNGGACATGDFGTTQWSQTVSSFDVGAHCSLWDQLHFLYQFPN